MSAHPAEPHIPHTHLTRWPHQLDYPSRKPHWFRDLHNNLHPHNPSCVDSGQNSVLTQVSDSRELASEAVLARGCSRTFPALTSPFAPPPTYSAPVSSLSLPTFTISVSKFLVYVSSPLSSLPPTSAPTQRVISSLIPGQIT